MLKKKSFLGFCMVFMLLLCAPAAAGETGGAAVIGLKSAAAAPGETVTLRVVVSENPGLASYAITVTSDDAAITVESIEAGACSAGGMFFSNPAQAKALWFDVRNMTATGELFTVKLRVGAEAAAGTHAIGLTCSGADTVDQSGAPVPVQVQQGTLEVTSADGQPVTPPDTTESDTPAEPSAGQPSSEKPSTEKPSTEKPSAEKPFAEKPATEQPSSDVPVETEPPVPEFADVPQSHWAYTAIRELARRGAVQGIDRTHFCPDRTITRAELVMLLYRLQAGSAPTQSTAFTDVPPDAWYAACVGWAAETGLVRGVTETQFSPGAPVTREQFAAILYRAMGDTVQRPAGNAAPFRDQGQIRAYAAEAVAALREAGVVGGYPDGSFRPQRAATRAEVCVMLLHALPV